MKQLMKIYFWQFLALILNFASIFVVTPFLTSKPVYFGIYSIVSSFYIFLSYADLGFITAGIKFASEAHATNKIKEEIDLIGFTCFILSVFVFVFFVLFLGLAWHPELIIKNLTTPIEIQIAKKLLFVLAISSPIFIAHKMIQIVFGVRLKDYIYQRFVSLLNIFKIISVFYFFGKGEYLITEYFIFLQICNLITVFIGFYLIRKNTELPLNLLFKSLRWNPDAYIKTKGLAYGSLFLTICWILYFEIDLFVIGRLMDPTKVAIYAIGLNVIILYRTLYGIFFAPFNIKFNHLLGIGKMNELKSLFLSLVYYILPFIVFPIITMWATMSYFLNAWVGEKYNDSIDISRFLLLSFIYSFISYPSGFIVIAFQKIKEMYKINLLIVIIYWMGIGCTYSYLGLKSFALFKFIAFTLIAVLYLRIMIDVFSISISKQIKSIVFPFLSTITVLFSLVYIMGMYWPRFNSKLDLAYYFIVFISISSFSIIFYICLSKIYRLKLIEIINKIKQYH